MKSFLKKVALVLVLAMVVTMLPAKAASAAETKGPLLRTKMTLYINGDYTGKYGDHGNVWYDKENYTVVFASSDENVATVGKWGKVTAVGVGRATITATFTNKQTGEVVESKGCTVYVKRNAAEIELGPKTREKLDALEVGETYQTTVFRTDAEGIVTKKRVKVTNDKDKANWSTAGITTSALTFESENKDVFTVDKYGKVTAVGEGKANLIVRAVQSENPNVVDGKKEYQVVATTFYAVNVVNTEPVVTNVTVKSVTELELEVSGVTTENVGSLKITKANGGDVTSLFKAPELSEDGKTVKLVKYFSLANDEELTFAFGDGESFTYTVKVGTAKFIIIDKPETVVVETPTDIEFRVVDENGIDLQVAFDSTKIKFEATETNYYTVIDGRKITMYQVDGAVTLKATYHTGNYDPETYNEIVLESAPFDVKCVKTPEVSVNSMKFMVGTGYDSSKLSSNELSMKMNDVYRLFAEITLSNNNKPNSNDIETSDRFTFESLTPAYLLVDASTGYLTPVKDGDAKILVKYAHEGITYNAVATIKVKKNSEVSYIKLKDSLQPISNSVSVDEKATIKIVGVDQYGDEMSVKVSNVESVGSLPNGIDAGTAKSYVDGLINTDNVVFSGADKTAGTYTYRVTAAGKTLIVNVVVRKPGATISYKVLAEKSNLEVNPQDVKGINDFKVTFKIVGIDGNGVASELVKDLPTNSSCTVKVGGTDAHDLKNNDGVWTATFAKSNGIVSGSAEVLSGSSIFVEVEDGYEGFDIQTGSFVVSATINGRTAVPATIAVSVKTNEVKCDIQNVKVVSTDIGYSEAILDQIRFTDTNRTFINKKMDDYSSPIQSGSKGTSYVYVRTIKAYEKVGKNYVFHKITINQLFSVEIP